MKVFGCDPTYPLRRREAMRFCDFDLVGGPNKLKKLCCPQYGVLYVISGKADGLRFYFPDNQSRPRRPRGGNIIFVPVEYVDRFEFADNEKTPLVAILRHYPHRNIASPFLLRLANEEARRCCDELSIRVGERGISKTDVFLCSIPR